MYVLKNRVQVLWGLGSLHVWLVIYGPKPSSYMPFLSEFYSTIANKWSVCKRQLKQ
jgi:hypothetical protein